MIYVACVLPVAYFWDFSPPLTVWTLLDVMYWTSNEPPPWRMKKQEVITGIIQQQIANKYFSYLRRFCGNNRDRPTYLCQKNCPSKLTFLGCWTLNTPHSLMFCVFHLIWIPRNTNIFLPETLVFQALQKTQVSTFEGFAVSFLNLQHLRRC